MPPQLQPEQALFLANAIFFPALRNEHRITKSVLESVAVGNADYRPDPASRTAMELATHIAIAENRFLDGIATGEFNFAAKPESHRTPAEVASSYSREFDRNFQRLSKLSGEQLAKIMDIRGVFQLPAVNFLQVTLHHSIHHRGQLCAYLRAMGSKVPSIYGESYDAAQTRKAAEA